MVSYYTNEPIVVVAVEEIEWTHSEGGKYFSVSNKGRVSISANAPDGAYTIVTATWQGLTALSRMIFGTMPSEPGRWSETYAETL